MSDSAAQLVGPVPHKLKERQEKGHSVESCGLQCSADFTLSLLLRRCVFQTASHVTAAHLCEVSHNAFDRPHSVAPVLHLVVPRLCNVAPAPLVAGHEQVLPAAARCRKREIETSVKIEALIRSSVHRLFEPALSQCEPKIWKQLQNS